MKITRFIRISTESFGEWEIIIHIFYCTSRQPIGPGVSQRIKLNKSYSFCFAFNLLIQHVKRNKVHI